MALEHIIITCDDYRDDDCLGICGVCQTIGIRIFQFNDYISRSMLWCEKCGCRSILDLDPGYVYGRIDDLPEKYLIPTVNLKNYKIYEWDKKEILRCILENFKKFKYYSVPCLWITRILNSPCSDWKTTRPVTKEEVLKFAASPITETAEELDIIEMPEDEHVHEEAKNADFALSLDVNSYDANTPSIEYPKNYDLGHGGVYIYLEYIESAEVEDCPGELKKMVYWGD